MSSCRVRRHLVITVAWRLETCLRDRFELEVKFSFFINSTKGALPLDQWRKLLLLLLAPLRELTEPRLLQVSPLCWGTGLGDPVGRIIDELPPHVDKIDSAARRACVGSNELIHLWWCAIFLVLATDLVLLLRLDH